MGWEEIEGDQLHAQTEPQPERRRLTGSLAGEGTHCELYTSPIALVCNSCLSKMKNHPIINFQSLANCQSHVHYIKSSNARAYSPILC